MEQPPPNTTTAELPAQPVEERPRASRWHSKIPGIRGRWLIWFAVPTLLASVPFIGWFVWYELKLPQATFVSEPIAYVPITPAELVDAAPPAETVPPVLEPISEPVQPTQPPTESRLVILEAAVERNSALLEKVEQVLTANNGADLYMAEKLDLIVDVKTIVESLLAMSHQVSTEIAGLAPTAFAAPNWITENPSPQTEPPFELIAIDRWQRAWYAVLALNGHVTMVAPPDSRAGWELVSLEPMARKALFRNAASGTEHELQVR